ILGTGLGLGLVLLLDLLGRLGLGLVGRRRLDRERFVLEQLVLDEVLQVRGVELQDLDALDELRRELQPQFWTLREDQLRSHGASSRLKLVRAVSASARTAGFAYSIAVPVGTPRASRLTLTRGPLSRGAPSLSTSAAITSAVPSPSKSGSVPSTSSATPPVTRRRFS